MFVNNAARYAPQEFTDLAGDEWDAFRSTNIDAFVFLTQAALPELEKTGGNVVAVGSVSGPARRLGPGGVQRHQGRGDELRAVDRPRLGRRAASG